MKLKRELGFWNSVSIGIGAMVGGGIFVLSGIGAGIAGPAVLIAFSIAGLLALFNAMSSAELAAAIPKSGATYEYAHELISPSAGFLSGWIFVVSKTLEAATVALAFGSYLFFILHLDPSLLALVISLILTSSIYFGIKITSEINNFFVLIKLAVLILFIAFGINFINLYNFHPVFTTNAYGLLQVSGILFFAYTGYARITAIGEEIKNPQKTIPKATALSLLISFLFYISVTAVAVGVAGSSALGSTNYPLSLAASLTKNVFLTLVVTFGALIATMSVVFSDILAISRTVFAMSRNKDLPGTFSFIDRRGSPKSAVIVSGVIVALLSFVGNLKNLAIFSSLTILLYYAITNLTALKLKIKFRIYSKIFPILGFFGCLILAFSLPPEHWILTILVISLGMIYFHLKKSKPKRS